MSKEPEVLEQEVPAALALVGGDIDVQVATAKRYPRSIADFIKKAESLACLNTEVAASCIYALPRKENGKQKNIEGPSARFAELMASAYGNIRAEGRTIGDDGRYVTARGTSWDVENNVAIAYEVKRKITNRHGETFTDDMIVVTGNAATSIALRNAILKVVPTAFWKPVYLRCRQVVAGDVKTLAARRDAMLKEFGIMGVTEERLLAAFGLAGKQDITLDHMATLRGFYTALRDGDTTIEEAFPEGGAAQLPQPGQRKSQQNGAEGSQQREARSRETPSAATGTVGGSTAPASSTPAQSLTSSPSPASEPPVTPAASDQSSPTSPATAPANERVGTITSVDVRPNGAALITLNTGFKCATNKGELIDSANGLRESQAVVELATHAPRNPANAPILDEILPTGGE